jgi:hypothetical protein
MWTLNVQSNERNHVPTWTFDIREPTRARAHTHTHTHTTCGSFLWYDHDSKACTVSLNTWTGPLVTFVTPPYPPTNRREGKPSRSKPFTGVVDKTPHSLEAQRGNLLRTAVPWLAALQGNDSSYGSQPHSRSGRSDTTKRVSKYLPFKTQW